MNNPPCEHHKTCGDCFGPNHVLDLENEVKYLANGYAEATEWNLATLEEMALIKSTSKSRIDRQKSICTKMLQHCRAVTTKIDWGVEPRTKYHRTQEILGKLKQGMQLDDVLGDMVHRCRT